jgi:hypothetical protein
MECLCVNVSDANQTSADPFPDPWTESRMSVSVAAAAFDKRKQKKNS